MGMPSATLALVLLATTAPTLTTGHSWIEKLEGPYGNGMSRMGMPTKSDSALIRYFCPHKNLDDCQVEAKHDIILEESAKRPCRSDMVSNPKTPTKPGAEVVLHWAANGHANGQSEGTCVQVMIAPFAEDPSIEDFVVIPGAECLPYWIVSDQATVETEGSITIPANLEPGPYTLFWQWNFTVFHFASCADIDVMEGDTPSYEEMVEEYLMDGCTDLPNPDEFCKAYSGLGEISKCSTRESLKDECGRNSCEGLGGGSMLYECVDCPPPTSGPSCPPPKAFYDDFSNGFDPNKWLKAHKSWNPNSGGVVAENLHFDSNSKRAVFNAHGLLYDGDIMGVKKEGTTIYRADSGIMTGAAIATRDYFGAGSYEVRMKVAEQLGVCSAIWTFFWKDGTPIVNHEIDIELPGRPNPAHSDIGFDYALMNTYIGESGSLVETNFTQLDREMNDGQFHTWRFDWHTEESERRVEFYVDGNLVSINRKNVPFYAGRLWIGAWFPNSWAGIPNFDVSQMEVDYVKFTPFENETYECPSESIPHFGWAPDTIFPESGEEPGDDSSSTPVKCKTPSTAPTPVPSPAVTSPPMTAAPVLPPTNPPVSTPTGNTPESYTHYASYGCQELHISFCENDQSGSYCKTWQNDGTVCQRSICHGHDFTVLNPCASPQNNDEEIYKSNGCEHLQNRDEFCVGLVGSGSYCEGLASVENGNSGTSNATNGHSVETTYEEYAGSVEKEKEEVDDDTHTQSTDTGDLNKEDKQIEEDFKKHVDKKRLKAYSSPEQCYFFCGLIVCFCTGLAWPICGVLFALMSSAMSILDYDVARTWTEWLAAAFGLLAVADIVAQYFQTYLFEVIGERMTRRIRTDYFRSLLRQDMGWFDDPANALGVLTSRLAVDIKLIRLTVGQGTGSTVSSMTALLAGFIIALIAAWQFALAFLATMPLLAMTEAINRALMKGGDSASKKKLGEISGAFGEYVNGIPLNQCFIYHRGNDTILYSNTRRIKYREPTIIILPIPFSMQFLLLNKLSQLNNTIQFHHAVSMHLQTLPVQQFVMSNLPQVSLLLLPALDQVPFFPVASEPMQVIIQASTASQG